MEYINAVELTGVISRVVKTDKEAIFCRINQDVDHDGTAYKKYFKIYVSPESSAIHHLFVDGSVLHVKGFLSVFKSQYGIKTIVQIEEATSFNNN